MDAYFFDRPNLETIRLHLDKLLKQTNKVEDALHVAISSVEEMDAIISWNFQHMANLRKSERFYGVNLEKGYAKYIPIVTPVEVMCNES